MKLTKIFAVIAFAVACASAEGLYMGFSTTLGAQFYTADTPYGDYDLFDQAGPAFHFGFDFGFPFNLGMENANMAISFGWDGWIQAVESNGVDDAALLMVIGPALNSKINRFVSGFRIGTSFVIETEEGQGGTLGLGVIGYVGYELTSNWSVIFDVYYTSTEHDDYMDIDVSGFGAGFSYNAF